jgi:hypothetical protein
MATLSKKSIAILNALTADLPNIGDAKKIDNTNGTFMPVCVEKINETPSGEFFSIAHYGEQNGDAMRDPDIVFIKHDRLYMPVSYRNDYLGIDREYARYDDSGKITHLAVKWINDCCGFCNTWMKNIVDQQNLLIQKAA